VEGQHFGLPERTVGEFRRELLQHGPATLNGALQPTYFRLKQ
jgi:hypothetical protein